MRRNPPNNDYFQLSANGGLPRHLTLEALRSPKFIARAVNSGRCFLCAAGDIDPTALCLVCRSFLTDEERRAAQRYYDGY